MVDCPPWGVQKEGAALSPRSGEKERTDGSIAIRPIRDGEEEQICGLIRRVLDRPASAAAGDGEDALGYIEVDAMLFRVQRGSLVLVAVDRDRVVGMIEMEHLSHLALLFVDRRYQGRGLARSLWEEARAYCRAANPGGRQFTVNSVEAALPVYRSFGFVECGPPRSQDGYLLTPMVLDEDAPRRVPPGSRRGRAAPPRR